MTEPNPASNLEDRKLELEIQRFQLEREKHNLEKNSKRLDFQKANNDSVAQLLSVIKYLNEQRNKQVQTVDEGFNTTTYTTESRELDPLEDDLANCCLKSLAKIVHEIGTGTKPIM